MSRVLDLMLRAVIFKTHTMKKPTAFQEIFIYTHSHVLFKTNKDKDIGNAHKYSMRPLSLKQIIHKQMFKGQTCYIRQHYEMFGV